MQIDNFRFLSFSKIRYTHKKGHHRTRVVFLFAIHYLHCYRTTAIPLLSLFGFLLILLHKKNLSLSLSNILFKIKKKQRLNLLELKSRSKRCVKLEVHFNRFVLHKLHCTLHKLVIIICIHC